MPPLTFRTLDKARVALGVLVVAFFVPFVVVMTALFGATPSQPVVAAIAAGVGVASTTAAVLWIRRRTIVVTIDEAGIRTRGARDVDLRWDEEHQLFVAGVEMWAGPVPLGSSWTTRLVAGDRRAIELSIAMRRAHDAVLAASTAASTRRLVGRLERGEPVDLGAIRIEANDVIISGTRIPRQDVRDIEVRDGKLRVRRDGGWLATTAWVRDVAHPGVAFTLLRTATGAALPRATVR